MRREVSVKVDAPNDLCEKYDAKTMKVKWVVVVKSDCGFVKARAELRDVGFESPVQPLTTWEVRELLRVPDEVTERAAEKFLEEGERRKQEYTELAEAI